MGNRNINKLSLKPTRAFIAITFPEAIIKEISHIQSLINKKQFIGKTTELENLHLTLKFLGEISQEKLEKVNSVLSEISFSEFQAKIESIGIFSRNNSPKIIWIKISSPELSRLQKQIDNSLSLLFPKEERFMSHLTIARIKHVNSKLSLSNYIKRLPLKNLVFPITEFKFFSSELKPLGPIYKEIKNYHLKK